MQNVQENTVDDESVDVAELEAALKGSDTDAPEKKEEALPEKFQGKSTEDLVNMYRNLESTLGKQSNELGELRKYNQMLLQQNQTVPTQNTPPAEEPEEEEIDWYSNPEQAVNKVVNKRLSKIEQMLQAQQQKEVLNSLQQVHPDIKETVQSPDFQQWVMSDQLRARLWKEGDSGYDVDKISFILNMYKDSKKKERQTSETPSDVNKVIGETGASKEAPSPGRQIRAADVQRLRANDPVRYEQLRGEIEQAYREGRVVRW